MVKSLSGAWTLGQRLRDGWIPVCCGIHQDHYHQPSCESQAVRQFLGGQCDSWWLTHSIWMLWELMRLYDWRIINPPFRCAPDKFLCIRPTSSLLRTVKTQPSDSWPSERFLMNRRFGSGICLSLVLIHHSNGGFIICYRQIMRGQWQWRLDSQRLLLLWTLGIKDPNLGFWIGLYEWPILSRNPTTRPRNRERDVNSC